MRTTLKREWHLFRLLLSQVPALLLTFFVLSLFAMNLLANKSITLPFDWMALDGGILVSWFAFLTMDILTKHFGPKAASQISVLGILINLALCLLFLLASRIPGMWGEAYVEGSEALLNHALDATFGGTWYVLAGSTVAFLTSSVLNNFLNWSIGKAFHRHPDGPLAYALRAYVSTAVGQFVDNLLFALLVSHIFFGWSLTQCFVCALTGMVAELLCEVLFSGFGYRVCVRWKKAGVGTAYLNEL